MSIEKSKEVEINQYHDHKKDVLGISTLMDTFKENQSFVKIPLTFIQVNEFSKGSTMSLYTLIFAT